MKIDHKVHGYRRRVSSTVESRIASYSRRTMRSAGTEPKRAYRTANFQPKKFFFLNIGLLEGKIEAVFFLTESFEYHYRFHSWLTVGKNSQLNCTLPFVQSRLCTPYGPKLICCRCRHTCFHRRSRTVRVFDPY